MYYANFYCYSIVFWTKFQGGAKVFKGRTASGGCPLPPPPPVGEARNRDASSIREFPFFITYSIFCMKIMAEDWVLLQLEMCLQLRILQYNNSNNFFQRLEKLSCSLSL